jgi:GH24 family phage-related lysozyme (muramidase)
MLKAFPGVEHFPGKVQGALMSLVFNRGTSVKGERRTEMKTIQDLVKPGRPDAQTLRQIAGALREMKRLWVNKGLDGLIARREAEARLVESAII